MKKRNCNSELLARFANLKVVGIGETIIPDSDGSLSTLLEQLELILGDAPWCHSFDTDGTGELIIRTGLDVEMSGELELMRDDDGEPLVRTVDGQLVNQGETDE